MSDVIITENVGFIVVIVALLIYQVTRFSKSKKPSRRDIPREIRVNTGRRNELREVIYERIKYTDGEYDYLLRLEIERYNKELAIYYTTYFYPILLTFSSIIILFDFPLGISLIISAFSSTFLMEIIIKIWNVGV